MRYYEFFDPNIESYNYKDKTYKTLNGLKRALIKDKIIKPKRITVYSYKEQLESGYFREFGDYSETDLYYLLDKLEDKDIIESNS